MDGGWTVLMGRGERRGINLMGKGEAWRDYFDGKWKGGIEGCGC